MPPGVPTWNRVLRFLLVGALSLQTIIILACVALEHANEEAGFLQYRLPQFLFWVYVWVGIGAPCIALATLVSLWANRSSLSNRGDRGNGRALRQLIVLCAVNVCAFAVWFFFGSLVFFGAGGNR